MSKKVIKNTSKKKKDKKMPFESNDVKEISKEPIKVPTVEKAPIAVSKVNQAIKEQKLNAITVVLKSRMNPRDLASAVFEIQNIIWGE